MFAGLCVATLRPTEIDAPTFDDDDDDDDADELNDDLADLANVYKDDDVQQVQRSPTTLEKRKADVNDGDEEGSCSRNRAVVCCCCNISRINNVCCANGTFDNANLEPDSDHDDDCCPGVGVDAHHAGNAVDHGIVVDHVDHGGVDHVDGCDVVGLAEASPG
jgi:hypothetical protein